MTLSGRVKQVLPHILLVGFLFVFGILLHECGHGVAAVLFGARIVRINVLGLDVWPQLRLDLQGGYWGRIWWQGTLTPVQRAWVGLSGNLATTAASVVALPLLWLPGTSKKKAGTDKPRPLLLRTTLVVLGLFFLDALLHTLPTLGLPMYLFFGKRDPASVSEGYLAAQALGCPGPAFQGIVVAYSLVAAGIITYRLILWSREAKTTT